MIPSNFHTHTTRCQHATGTEREYIEAALSVGMKRLGFADHCPVPFDDPTFTSTIRMSLAEAVDYVDTIRALAEEYRSDIDIFVGFEMEYMPKYFDQQIEFFDSLGIDYLIMGEHFLDDENGGHYTGTSFTDPAFLSSYVDTVIEGMTTGRFKYLAHPDLINFNGDEEIYLKEMGRLCQAMKDMNIPLEFNGIGLAGKRHYPCRRFWKIASETGNTGIVGLDAHSPDILKNQQLYDACVGYLQEFNVPQVFL